MIRAGSAGSRRIVFLLGAGASIHAGMPSTRTLGGELLPPRNFWRHSDSLYYIGEDPSPLSRIEQDKEICEVIPIFVSILVEIVRDTDRKLGRTNAGTNYEEIIFLIDKLLNAFMVPIVDPSTEVLRAIIERKLAKEMRRHRLDWWRLLFETGNCIADLIWRMLARRPTTTDYLEYLTLGREAFGAKNTAIITTNQDILVETYFRSRSSSFCDGFVDVGANGRMWQPKSFENEPQLMLLKVHGSINWFRYVADQPFGGSNAFVADCRDFIFRHPTLGDATLLPGRPQILLGTYNKREEYTGGLYAELFCRARRQISDATHIVVTGYGFGDIGINRMIWDKMNSTSPANLMLCHPSFTALTRTATIGVARLLEELRQRNLLRWYPWKTEQIEFGRLISDS